MHMVGHRRNRTILCQCSLEDNRLETCHEFLESSSEWRGEMNLQHHAEEPAVFVCSSSLGGFRSRGFKALTAAPSPRGCGPGSGTDACRYMCIRQVSAIFRRQAILILAASERSLENQRKTKIHTPSLSYQLQDRLSAVCPGLCSEGPFAEFFPVCLLPSTLWINSCMEGKANGDFDEGHIVISLVISLGRRISSANDVASRALNINKSYTHVLVKSNDRSLRARITTAGLQAMSTIARADVILVPIKRYSGAKGTSFNKFSALRNPAEIQGGKRSGLGEWGLGHSHRIFGRLVHEDAASMFRSSSGSSKEISITVCQQGEVHTAVTFLGYLDSYIHDLRLSGTFSISGESIRWRHRKR
ncbi:hypothetical protein I7I51_06077 [Histoplasma capsulatum]|uniref:Uncharacterized protein n=1 Tax=Ajellomyces capsulatus TaxID=5037 RepID=A0A8A1MH76_AJECA|nr:hypothetical protein I7I51_06077 [Histoplasma capsulatum]